MERAIIIFAKNPVLGKVKTRLAKTIGDEKALEVYKELLEHTSTETGRIKADRYVFFSDDIPENDSIWPDTSFIYEAQEGDKLGERMHHAFQTVLDIGYDKVLIVGSDCFELTFDLIEKAFEELEETDVVIGPARDGGYYLLGMKELIPTVFEDIEWSTDTVFDSTIEALIQSKKTWYELPILSDIDTEEDLHLAQVKKFYRKIVDQSMISN